MKATKNTAMQSLDVKSKLQKEPLPWNVSWRATRDPAGSQSQPESHGTCSDLLARASEAERERQGEPMKLWSEGPSAQLFQGSVGMCQAGSEGPPAPVGLLQSGHCRRVGVAVPGLWVGPRSCLRVTASSHRDQPRDPTAQGAVTSRRRMQTETLLCYLPGGPGNLGHS